MAFKVPRGQNVEKRRLLIVGSLAVLLLLTTANLNVLASPDGLDAAPGIKAAELAEVTPTSIVRLDRADMLSKATGNQRISMNVAGAPVSFMLAEGQLYDESVQVISNDPIEATMAQEHLASMHFFTGMDINGGQRVVASISPSYMSMSITLLNGTEYRVRPYSSTDDGYYAVYSQYDLQPSSRVSIDPLENGTLIVTPATIEGGVQSLPDMQPWSNASEDNEVSDPSSAGSIDLSVFDTADGGNASVISISPMATTGNTYSLARIILACDSNYYNLYPSTWSDRMASTLWYVNGLYQSQAQISFRLVAVVSIPSAYCTATDATTLTNQFQSYIYNVAGHTSDHDVAHLFSGKNFDGDVYGHAAYIPGADRTKWNPSQYGAGSVSEQTHDDFTNEYAFGHEVGHTFNGDHDFAGTINGKYSWMYPSYSAGNMVMQFTPANAQRISTWARQAMDIQQIINPGPSSTSSDNLQVSAMAELGDWVYQVGRAATVTYSIKNTGSSSITISNLFVGARDASGNNRDFGYQYNVVIGSQQTYLYTSTYTPQSSGQWTLWPAYYVNGHYGPYQWLTVQPTMYYNLTSTYWSGHDTQTWAGQTVSLFYRMGMFSNVPTPTVGSTVWMYFTLYNGATGTGSNTFNSIYVSCLNPSGGNADFGYMNSQTLQKVGNQAGELVGGGCTVFASRTLSSSGTWLFWPCYYINGDWGGRWLTRSITV
jgi:hypothetical protein